MHLFPSITSVSNFRVKDAVRLRTGRNRRDESRFLIDGIRETARALESGIAIDEVFVLNKNTENSAKSKEFDLLLRSLSQKNTQIWSVSEPVFEKIAFGQRLEGIIAVAQRRYWNWNDLQLPECPIITVLERIEKPGNIGAVFRSADGAGLDAVFIADPLCDHYNTNAIRASLGTIFRIPVIVDSSENIVRELSDRNISIAAAKCDGSVPYTEFDYRNPCAIVLGSEADGLTDSWNRDFVQAVRLPMLGIADSLNVSTAAAVIFYEARRQRNCM